MKSLSNLGIGLSLVFGCILLALVAELYYLLWWKKRIANRDIEDDYGSSPRELFYLLCWKKPSLSLSSSALNLRTSDAHGHDSDEHIRLHSDNGMDFLFKPYGEDSAETEIMRLHNLSGPPRFLFTIKEETKEDMESEDGKSIKSKKGSRGRSLSDVLHAVETPFLTPLSSPPFLTPPLTPLDYYMQHGFNPLFESSTDAEMNRVRSSPPPKFKFLKDAEEKLYRRRLMEGAAKDNRHGGIGEDGMLKATPTCSKASDEGDGSFITILISKNKEKEQHASSSQVLPLPSSPSNIKPANKRSMFHER